MESNLHKTIESSRIRIVPQLNLSRQITLKDNPETETLDPQSVYNNTLNHTLHHHFTNSEHNQQLPSTMPTTVPHLQDTPLRNEENNSTSGGGKNTGSGNNSQLDTSSENLKYRIGSSEESSQKSGGSGKIQQQKPKTKKPNSRIKIYN